MIVYIADCREKAYNKQYPHALQVSGAADVDKLRAALDRDYTGTLFNEAGRDLDNFIKSDCLLLDCDNGGEDPQAWTTPEDIADVFGNVGFYVHYSRNHNKVKHPGEPKEQSARPRFHCLFPITETADPERIRALKETANRVYNVFDKNAKDAARLFFGTEAPQVDWIPGDLTLDLFLEQAGIPIETDAERLERERAASVNQQAAEAEQAPPASEDPPDPNALTWDSVIARDDPPAATRYDARAAILSALDAIDPATLDYSTWLNIGLALHFEGFNCSTWDDWSARDSARYKPGDCGKRWIGFKDDRGAGNVTGGTIIEEARRRGWEYTPPEDPRSAPAENPPERPEAAQTETEGQTPAEDAKNAAEETQGPSETVFDPDGKKIDAFLDDIFTDRYKPIPTGLQSIDDVLQGGFLPQTLTLLGAPPGCGKTSLCTMIFESAAKNGNRCLYINLEMSAPQLWARSLSRILYLREGLKLNALDILRAYKYGRDSETGQAICRAAEEYKRNYASNLAYNPGRFTTDLDALMKSINNLAEAVEKSGERAPMLCIDYMQLLTGQGREDSTETIKRAVYLLKKYAINHNTVSLAIIAQSRAANKATEATQQAGRDTSALEYTADMQLQLKNDSEEEEEGSSDFVKLYVTKSRFTPASNKRAAQRFQFYGGQSYLQPLICDSPAARTGKQL